MAIRDVLRRLIAIVWKWNRSPPVTEISDVSGSEPEPQSPPPPPKPKAERYRATYLRRDILNQLDKYQVYVKRLKKYDRETYETYRRLGAYVVDRDGLYDCPWEPHQEGIEGMRRRPEVGVNGSFLKTLPGFGAIAMAVGVEEHHASDDHGGFLAARFVFFQKLDRVAYDVQSLNSGTTYRVRFYWDDKLAMPEIINGRDRGWSHDMLVNLAPDGTVRPLRVLQKRPQQIRHKRGRYKNTTTTIQHRRWTLPDFGHDRWKQTPDERLADLFVFVANFWIAGSQSSMIRVTATKDRVVMPFVVDVLRTPQFFADREKVLTESGRTAPIFHLVRTHERKGRPVKLHFSGLRQFEWNGYQIRITVPGKDHFAHDEMPLGAEEAASDEEMRDPHRISIEAMAEFIADHIDAPAGERSVF